MAKIMSCPQTGKTYYSLKEAAEDLGINPCKARDLYYGYISCSGEEFELIPKDPFDARKREEEINRKKAAMTEKKVGKAVFCPQTQVIYPTIKDAAAALGITAAHANRLYHGYTVAGCSYTLIPENPFDLKRHNEVVAQELAERQKKKEREERWAQERFDEAQRWREEFADVLANYDDNPPEPALTQADRKLQECNNIEVIESHFYNIIRYLAEVNRRSYTKDTFESINSYCSDDDILLTTTVNWFSDYITKGPEHYNYGLASVTAKALKKGWINFANSLSRVAPMHDLTLISTYYLSSKTRGKSRIISKDEKRAVDAFTHWFLKRKGCNTMAELYQQKRQNAYFCAQQDELPRFFDCSIEALWPAKIIVSQCNETPQRTSEMCAKAFDGIQFMQENWRLWVAEYDISNIINNYARQLNQYAGDTLEDKFETYIKTYFFRNDPLGYSSGEVRSNNG